MSRLFPVFVFTNNVLYTFSYVSSGAHTHSVFYPGCMSANGTAGS